MINGCFSDTLFKRIHRLVVNYYYFFSYYTSTVNGDSAKKLVYKMDLNNPSKKECFSCRVREDCVYGTAYFSTQCAHVVLTCKGPSVPQFNIYDKVKYNRAIKKIIFLSKTWLLFSVIKCIKIFKLVM